MSARASTQDPAVLQALVDPSDPVICDYCREAVVHDGEQWWHVRTGLSAHWRTKVCKPLCRECERDGLVAVGSDAFVGSGIRFVVQHFLCHEHIKHTSAFIERT